MTKEAPQPLLPDNAVPISLTKTQQVRLFGIYNPDRSFFAVIGRRNMPGDKYDSLPYYTDIFTPDGTRIGGNMSVMGGNLKRSNS